MLVWVHGKKVKSSSLMEVLLFETMKFGDSCEKSEVCPGFTLVGNLWLLFVIKEIELYCFFFFFFIKRKRKKKKIEVYWFFFFFLFCADWSILLFRIIKFRLPLRIFHSLTWLAIAFNYKIANMLYSSVQGGFWDQQYRRYVRNMYLRVLLDFRACHSLLAHSESKVWRGRVSQILAMEWISIF